MAKTFKFTREQIIDAGLELCREKGVVGLTARGIGKKLGSSSKVVFGLFKNMAELEGEVMKAAYNMHNEIGKSIIATNKYPIYKAVGMGYILFAKNEPNLFRWLYMRDRTNEDPSAGDEALAPLIEMIAKMLDISIEKAKLFQLEMWIVVHGIATMIATSYLDMDIHLIEDILTDHFEGLKKRYKEQ